MLDSLKAENDAAASKVSATTVPERHDKLAPILKLLDLYSVHEVGRKSFVEGNLIKLPRGLDKNYLTIWAIDVSGFENNYLLHLNLSKLPEVWFQKGGVEALKTTALVGEKWKDYFAKVQAMLERPKISQENNQTHAGTCEHLFFLEMIKDGEYKWAVREFRGNECADYFTIADLLTCVDGSRVKVAWKVQTTFLRNVSLDRQNNEIPGGKLEK